MKAYTRADFIKLPENTIYSRITDHCRLIDGLYCKCSGDGWGNDWVEQDLISEVGFPNDITGGEDAYDYQENLRDTFQEFRTDLDCAGRDGRYRDEDVFVVWDREDISKLHDYLGNVLKQQP